MSKLIENLQQLIESSHYDEAEKEAYRLLREDPDNLEIMTTLARVLAIQEKNAEATTLIDNIIQLDTKNYYPLYLLGIIKGRQEDYDEAIKLYNKALIFSPKNGTIYYRLGQIHNNSKYKYKNEHVALLNFRKAVTSDNPPPEAFLALVSLEPSSRSIYILQNGISRYPEDENLNFSLCQKLYSLEEYSKCIDAIDSAINHGIASDSFKRLKAEVLYKTQKYEEAFNALQGLENDDARDVMSTRVFEGLLMYEAEKLELSEKILEKVIAEDISNHLNFNAHIILICCHIRNSNLEKAEKIFKEIPTDTDLTNPIFLSSSFLEIDTYFLEALDGLISAGEETTRNKAQYFRTVYEYMPVVLGENKLPIDGLEKIKKDFIALIDLPEIRKSRVHECLYYVSLELKNWTDALSYYFLSEIHEEKHLYLGDIDDKVLEGITKNQKGIEKFFSVLEKMINDFGYRSHRIAEGSLSQLITFFYSKERFDLVIRVSEKFSYTNIFEAGCVFEVAYAYNKINNKKQAKNFYKAYLRDVGENFAVANNLALLEEDFGNLAEAERLSQLAMDLDANDEKAKNNHARIVTRIQKEEEHKRAYQKAADLFRQESDTVRFLAVKLYSTKADDDIIFYNESKISSISGLETEEIEFRINDFIKKKYFEEITNESISFDGRLLRPNPIVTPLLQDELRKLEEKDATMAVANDILSKNLDSKYGYNDLLLNNLIVIKSAKLSKMLERDLYETVIALAIKSYKSALILCGSIAEAVLLDNLLSKKEDSLKALERILSKENKQLKSDDKHLDRWVLDRLLDVALESRIISENLYHWGHGLRGFRNLVHPGVEQRQAMEVSRENAEMAWNVVKRLLSEISAKDQT